MRKDLALAVDHLPPRLVRKFFQPHAFSNAPAKRSLLRVVLLADDREGTADSVERLMGTKAEARFAFISDKAEFASEDLLDV